MGISSYSSSVISVHVSTKCPQYMLLTLLVKDKLKLITDSQQTNVPQARYAKLTSFQKP